MQIPDPHYMELAEWANGTVYALGEYTSLIQFFPNMDWREWGMQFNNNPTLGQLNPPNPYDFSDWKPWAEQLQDALYAAGGSTSQVGGGPPPFPPLLNGRYLISQSGNFLTAQSGAFITTQQ